MRVILKNLKDTEKFVGETIEGLSHPTEKFWNSILQNREDALLICLSGQLGAGKTALVKSFAGALGIKKHITSPTFVIIKRYKLKNKTFKNLIHIDAYRLKNGGELLSLGFAEMLKNKENLIFLEWPENVSDIIPSKTVIIKIKVLGETKREVEIKLT